MDDQHEYEIPEHLLHDLEAERMVIGCCLISTEALLEVRDALKPGHIEDPILNVIYKAILAVEASDEPVDYVTVTAELRTRKQYEKVGGMEHLMALANAVPTASNVGAYIDLIREKRAKRELLEANKEVAHDVEAGLTVEEIADRQQRRLAEIGTSRQQKPFAKISDVILTTYDTIEQRFTNATNNTGQQIVTGTPYGFADLDAKTAGLHGSDLIILAARPAVGKTAFALNVAENVGVKSKETVAIFSLEMSKEQLVERMICAHGRIDAGKLRTGQLDKDDWPLLTITVGTLAEAPIFIDDTPGITVAEIRAKVRRLKAEQGKIGLILIDYLQLISGGGRGGNRQQDVSEISRTLKLIAREFDAPVVALSQLSRAVEQRNDKRPMMSDLRESGSIEQDADLVAFLYRDDYYNPETDRKNIVEVIIAKQRSGPTGTVELVFLKNFNKFVSLERAPGA